MQPRIRVGLIVGSIGLVLNACIAGLVGLCGPVASLIAGGLAGFFAVQREKPVRRNDGAVIGATAGGITGGLMIIGQMLGGIATLVIFQMTGAQTIFGQVPSGGAASVGYYLSGLGTGFCFGVVGALLAAGVGAGVGYVATQEQAAPPAGM